MKKKYRVTFYNQAHQDEFDFNAEKTIYLTLSPEDKRNIEEMNRHTETTKIYTEIKEIK